MFLAAVVSGGGAVRYVNVNNTTPAPPYTNWAAAATTIQQAVDAAVAGEEVVVTNGIYASGGRAFPGLLTNRVAVDKPLTVRSVNGPDFTKIDGLNAVRCVYLTDGATLSGFTVMNGNAQADGYGGGVNCRSSAALISVCVLTGNKALRGGGTYLGSLTNCTLTGNRADRGGGVHSNMLYNCTITGNSATNYGGGAEGSTLYNCTLTGNSGSSGGGARFSTLYNCTVSTNWANYGGGTYWGSLTNCTLTGNFATNYGAGLGGLGGGAMVSTLYNCTLTGNTATGSQRCGGGAENSTLYNCTLTGNLASYGGGADSSTLYNCTLTGNRADRGGGAAAWITGSSTLYNCTITGNSATNYGGGAYYCTLTNCTVSTNSANYGGGTYWGSLTNCTLTGNRANDSGGGAAGSGSILNNCTLTGNRANDSGGGAAGSGSILNNCRLEGNWANNYGGGSCSNTLNNCTVTGNSAYEGGGAYSNTLNNCTVTGNLASYGGGARLSRLYNCIVYYNNINFGSSGTNYDSCTLTNCCSTPLPTGAGNISQAPVFMDMADGNLRLQSSSPCIDAGNNSYAPGTTDVDGRPRIVGLRVDIGAYEYQPAVSGLFMGWLEQYGLPTNGSGDYADGDGDGMNNWQEWICGTNPTNALSVLKVLPGTGGVQGRTVSWQSVPNRSYFIQRSSNLIAPPAFQMLATNILGEAGMTTYTDTSDVGAGPFFYRVGVGN